MKKILLAALTAGMIVSVASAVDIVENEKLQKEAVYIDTNLTTILPVLEIKKQPSATIDTNITGIIKKQPIGSIDVNVTTLPGGLIQIKNTMDLLIAAGDESCDIVTGCSFGGFKRTSQYAGDGGNYGREIIDMSKLDCQTIIETNTTLAVHCETNLDKNISVAESIKNVYPLMQVFGITFPAEGVRAKGDKKDFSLEQTLELINNETILKRVRTLIIPGWVFNHKCDYMEGCEIKGFSNESFRIEKNQLIVRTFIYDMSCVEKKDGNKITTSCQPKF